MTHFLLLLYDNILSIYISLGVYPLKPVLPAVGGGEGVGVVREMGEGVTMVKKGDWVVPAGPGLGISLQYNSTF